MRLSYFALEVVSNWGELLARRGERGGVMV
jgi:hypothetical protein